MKCNVVRDLLPLYLDQLCEEETSQEIRHHLEGCEKCRQRWEEMGSPVESVIGQLENETVSIEPMKKYRKKMKRKNRMLVLVILLAIALIGGMSYLSYGQIKHSGHSFETISQSIRFHYIGKEFARGNLEPLLSSLAIVGEDPEYAYYAGTAYGNNEDAFVRDTKEYIRECYTEYFQGKTLKLKKVITEYHTNLVYNTRNLMVALVYEVDGIEYFIRLERNAGEKYYVAEDDFVESTEPVEYHVQGTDDEDAGGDSETEDEDSSTHSSLLDCQTSLFHSLQPFDDVNLFVARRTIRNIYRECRESGETLSPHVFMTSLLYTTEEGLRDRTLHDAYQGSMLQHAQGIIEQNYWISDMHYNMLSYDREKHMFRYLVSLSLTNIETEEECVLTVECYRHASWMLVIPGTEKVLGENIPQDARTAMLELWKVTI